MLVALVAVAAVVAAYWILRERKRRVPGPAEKLAALLREVEPQGGVVFQTVLQGQPVAFLLLDCEVFLLDASAESVTRSRVLKPGFYPWFTACTGQSIRAADGYVIAVLENRALGAGGGNTSGGTYRSRDGRQWEKQTPKGWVAVEGEWRAGMSHTRLRPDHASIALGGSESVGYAGTIPNRVFAGGFVSGVNATASQSVGTA